MPACQHRVEKTMIVDTVASPDEKAKARIARGRQDADRAADDRSSGALRQGTSRHAGDCELEALARQFGATQSRLDRREIELPSDDHRSSSPSTTTPASFAIAASAAAT